MRRWATGFSLLLNLLLLSAFFLLIQRLGGFRYTMYRAYHSEAGLYAHRKSLFVLFPDRPGAMVMLGDSQIEQCEWRELLGDSLHILNRGITGDQVAGVLDRLEDIMRNRPNMVVLCVGINDLLLGKAIPEIAETYRSIVQQLRKPGAAPQVVLVSVLPINNQIKNTGLDPRLIPALNLEIQQIARSFALPYVDLYTELSDAQGQLLPTCTEDGLHLNGQGYLVWKKQLDKILLGL